MSSAKKIAIVAIIGFVLIASIVFSINRIPNVLPNVFRGTDGKLWDMDSVNEKFEIPLPADAEMIEVSGHMGRGGGLNLSFQSSSETMEEYASIFCDGIFHEGYDPFNAIDVLEPQADAIRITMDGGTYNIHSYYSYSPGTPGTISGSRCRWSDKGFQLQVIVDKTKDEQYSIRLELLYNCTKCGVPRITSEP